MSAVTEHLDRKNAGEFFQATANPFAAMRIIAPRPAIAATQMIATHAAADQMEHLNISFGKDFTTIHAGHTQTFQNTTGAA
jgi:hypothetical protein